MNYYQFLMLFIKITTEMLYAHGLRVAKNFQNNLKNSKLLKIVCLKGVLLYNQLILINSKINY